MTNQQAFDTALAGLRTQGCRAVDGFGHCMYLTPDGGKRCGIGFLCTEAQCHEWEGYSAFDLAADLGLGRRFASELQSRLHDHLSDEDYPARLEAAAEQFAKSWNLKF